MNNVLQVLQERFLLQKEFLGDEKPINKVQPLVSVSVPTYQHSRYISECLDGILMQQTSFPIEIIIGEDGSTDGTREICEEYAIKHQDKIRLFNRDRKLSQYVDKEGHVTRFNGIWNRMSARGKYIAICEGDDYWTDPLKLQIQVDFLEQHLDYAFICHRFVTYDQEKGFYRKEYAYAEYHKSSNLIITPRLFFKVWITQPLTALIRKSSYLKVEEMKKNNEFHYWRDVHLFYYLLKDGKGLSLNRVMGVYRWHNEGIASKLEYNRKMKLRYDIYKELYICNLQDKLLRKAFLKSVLRLMLVLPFEERKKIYREENKILNHFYEKGLMTIVIHVPIKLKRVISHFYQCLKHLKK